MVFGCGIWNFLYWKWLWHLVVVFGVKFDCGFHYRFLSCHCFMVGDFGYGIWMLDLVDKYDCGFLVVTFGCGVQQGFGCWIWLWYFVVAFGFICSISSRYLVVLFHCSFWFGCIVSLQFLVWLYCGFWL